MREVIREVIRAHQWSSVVISGHQWSSVIIRAHQSSSGSSSELISAHQWSSERSSELISGHQWSSLTIRAHQSSSGISSELISGHQSSSGSLIRSSVVIRAHQNSSELISSHQCVIRPCTLAPMGATTCPVPPLMLAIRPSHCGGGCCSRCSDPSVLRPSTSTRSTRLKASQGGAPTVHTL